MKKILINNILLILLLNLLPGTNVSADTPMTEKQAMTILTKQIKKDKLYENRISFSCLLFTTEKKTDSHFNFALYEKHGGNCPGDPETSPLIDRFRIDRITGQIEWYDVIMAEFVRYNGSVN